jgi:hypothetical protein
MEVKILNSQSLFDIAIQAAGGMEAAFDIAMAGARSITDVLVAGASLAVPEVANRQVADYYSTHGIKPATALSANDATLLREGIEFWLLEYDFIVS